ncbi:prolyl oligopeptidase family serine peptidase [Streptomyces sp. TRM 70351]|uniref:prolyl oligopeptidase family serine peptidase n=1 Tax=Streptomyces sp. TRM 70351 TaxID=3116552 RepID=UPI002E7C1DF8|nr:prolyl oligopeptidase family serine peptidase [Streptomyces sp. TRM 70351]MEE1927907.1 prolyl oligopeptidase family serine peptidase [Streptomyces sp. TRM 70351]
MAQHVVPARDARLGRPLGARGPVEGVLLLLPGGTPQSLRRASPLAAAGALVLARHVVREADRCRETLTAHVVHYRYRGWNGQAAHPLADTAWALDEVVRRYGDVPVCLAGTGLGARAALRAAAHPAVASVVALAPWLPPGDEEPVAQLADARVLLVHGTDDERCAPERSYRFGERARKQGVRVCRFEVHTDGHALRRYRTEVSALTADFVLGTLCGRDFSRPVRDALAAPLPLGLRMPLASGYGQP